MGFDARLPGNCATALPRVYHKPACSKSSRPSQVSAESGQEFWSETAGIGTEYSLCQEFP